MLSIITPCCRPDNLKRLYDSIDFSVGKLAWYIIYDTSKRKKYKRQFEGHKQINELECSDETGSSGNPQRNLALSLIKEGFVYFLDDDNIIHPSFWKILPGLDSDYFYTWDQERNDRNLEGNNITVGNIDTAMYIVPKTIIKGITWEKDMYEADGVFIETIYRLNKSKHIYIPQVLAYYNRLR